MLQSIIPFLCIVSGALAVDGNWSAWGSWGGCSQTCGSGTRYRSRSCSNPFPSFNGADCVGDTQVSQTCNTNTCPAVDGAWSDWGDWGDCSNACGSGTKIRTRDCTDPTPMYGGSDCSVSNTQSQSEICTGPCAVDGVWGSWGSYGDCTHTCGGGKKARRRSCNNPVPSNGGDDCSGDTYNIADCNTGACSVPAAGSYVQICPTGFFTCESGIVGCINNTLQCDCTNHCSDSSDESTSYASCPAVPTCTGSDVKSSIAICLLLGLMRFVVEKIII
ncbi:coadhesin-like [Mytilus galloprovincialis]|uniref:coadhesin-like n=1 Tax=Mytilus galloprovincialis TaxID=29158 RepID=UPI003F7CC1A3